MKTLWRCNNNNCNYEYLGEDFVDVPDTDCPECGWHDSVLIVEEFEDSTLAAWIARGEVQQNETDLTLAYLKGFEDAKNAN